MSLVLKGICRCEDNHKTKKTTDARTLLVRTVAVVEEVITPVVEEVVTPVVEEVVEVAAEAVVEAIVETPAVEAVAEASKE